MNLINAEHINHSFTNRILLDDVNFSLADDEKTGIIGTNGTGKSTLLRIIAGELTPESGTLTTRRNLKIAYLPQNPVFDATLNVIQAAVGNINDYSDETSITDTSTQDFASASAQAQKMLTKLGISNFNQPVGELSGGQRKRIALVHTLLTPCDVLLLDEPTNHLDSAMSEWLEDYLKNMKKALVMITHDRYFLDSVVNHIVEINNTKLYSYDCNYLGYIERKAEREEIALATERKNKSILRKEIAWMMRGARARSTKQKAHIARYEQLRDIPDIEIQKNVEISSASSRIGKTTIELDKISKAYGDNILISDFTYIFLPNDRIGFVGSNGCGKSTLMKIIMGLVQVDSGNVTIGQTIKTGYFSQENEEMDNSMKVIDYVKEGGEVIYTDDGPVTAAKMLERFLFTGDICYSKIEKLSGGEKRRLHLLRILMTAPNVLIFDEPTNDLDIATLNILEDYLDSFKGIVITVSHDRYFLDRIAPRIFAFEGSGKICQYEGGYTDYLNALKRDNKERQSLLSSNPAVKNTTKSPDNANNSGGSRTPHSAKLKMTYKEAQEYEHIEADIHSMEDQLNVLDTQIVANSSDFVKLKELTEKKELLANELDEKMDRWMYLEDLNEKINN